ncbi:dedicator of cytokinesis protein 7-like isoform X1 [Hemiscyllium ocellatum]|uniref:dedicator of cytokinesis protein 7-like isoform X1 n=1 Tax=Hemiscyllium ocellatum TaxID=170820 RepID=UPI002965EBE2|nr:dedicator of cytokinesis protein 7-like isoform X1 [Hemiscyllium ocellatum]
MASFTFGERQQYLQLGSSEAATGKLKPFTPHFRRTSLTDVQEFSPSAVPSCDIPFSPDPVDPLDFEVHIANQMENSELGSLTNLVDFPKDDIEVTLSPRAHRTVNPAVPDDWNNLSPQVRSCVKTYTKNWLTVIRRYQKCSIGSRRKGLNLPHQAFECDESFNMEKQNFLNVFAAQADELETEVPDLFIQNLLQPTDQEEVDRKNEIMRKSGRLLDLFMLFPPSDEDEAMYHRTIPPSPCEQFEQRLQINFLEFKFEIEIEPMFLILALYDLKERRKISENFYLDMNLEEFRDISQSQAQSLCYFRKAIFSITQPSSEIYLVIKVEKVLQQGSITDCAEPYMTIKENETAKTKEKVGKLRFQANSFCQRLSLYRMPFAWAAVDLVSLTSNRSSQNSLNRETINGGSGSEMRSRSLDNRNHIPQFGPVQHSLNMFNKQEEDKLSDEDLMKFITDEKKPSPLLRRLRKIPGIFRFEVSPVKDTPFFCFTPDFLELKSSNSGDTELALEVLEFPLPGVLTPYTIYRNLLYVYPQFFNFTNRQGSARNITVKIQLMGSEKVNNVLPVIFGKSGHPEYVNESYTPVAYHSRSPFFYEEVKIKLPSRLTEGHHLLFTFYHINCQPKQSQDSPEVPLGYSWLSILDNGHLRCGTFELPVNLDKPPSPYSVSSSSLPGLKKLDNRKAVFKVELRPVSTVHTQERTLERFFSLCEAVGEHYSLTHQTEAVNQAVSMLRQVCLEELVKFLNVVLDKLLPLLHLSSRMGAEGALVSKEIFDVLVAIVDRLQNSEEVKKDSLGRSHYLASYVHYMFNMPVLHEIRSSESEKYATLKPEAAPALRRVRLRSTSDPAIQPSSLMLPKDRGGNQKHAKLFHEELAYCIVLTNGQVRDQVYRHLWFFFELLIKSMSQYLSDMDRWSYPVKIRFSESFQGIVNTMVNIGTEFVKNQDAEITEMTNLSLGFFLNDLLSLMDRGFVLRLIGHHHRELLEKAAAWPHLHDRRIHFLRVVCSHEHFVTLNLPLASRSKLQDDNRLLEDATVHDSVAGMFRLSRKFHQQHFLVGLLLKEIADALKPDSGRLIRREAVNLLHGLLASHDKDPRLWNRVLKAKVASLYLPLLGIILTALPQLQNLSDSDGSKSKLTARYSIPRNASSLIFTSPVMLTPHTTSTNRYSTPIAGFSSPNATITAEVTQTLLFCLLWILKNADEATIKGWMQSLPTTQMLSFLELLDLCVSNFEYEGQPSTEQVGSHVYRKSRDMKARLEDAIFGTTGARSEMMKRREYPGIDRLFSRVSVGLQEKLRWRKDLTQWRQAVDKDKLKAEIQQEALISGNLTVETNLIVLDTLELVIQQLSSMPEFKPVATGVLKVLIHSLCCNQSTLYLQNCFNTQRALIAKFPEVLFDEDSEHCMDLCLLLLQRCMSHFESTRVQASASLYLLLRQSYKVHFSRMKMYITLSLASLAEKISNQDEHCLQKSFGIMLIYLETDKAMEGTSFSMQVEELLRNLKAVLCDTVKLQAFLMDVDMQIDLMFRIAKGLQNYLDLRLMWLRNIAMKHIERKKFAEAAHCMVHSAALVAEYLNRVEGAVHLPMGSVNFQKISINVLEESLVCDEVFSMEKEGICSGNSFSEEGLLELLDEAVELFNKAEYYEAVYEIYKIIVPIAEFYRNIKKLSAIHGNLKETFDLILNKDSKRLFGTFFRVGFYGSLFGELNGKEYIYKEPGITNLVEISARLQEFYKKQFGKDQVEIIKESSLVKKGNLNPSKAYLQITYVEPYFEEYELKNRVSYYERNSNLRRFIYSTPYTLNGRAHGELSQQYKRKTILTTLHAFPYIKTRISVIERQEISLRPIEAVIEDMQKKTHELAKATSVDPPNMKLLQMVLQGSVGTTVNQGPLEVAQVFLSEIPDDPKLFRHHNKLRICFKEFLKRCDDALKKNKCLITHDQLEYQRELERNYEALQHNLQPFINRKIPHLYVMTRL